MASELFKLMGRIVIEMDDAETELKKFESLLNAAVTALQSIDTKLTGVNSALNTMDTRLSDANGELTELHTEASTANRTLNTLDGNVSSLNGTMNTMDSRVNAVVNELSQLNTYARQAGTHTTTLNTKLKGLSNPFTTDGALSAGAVWLGNILEDLTYKVLDLSWEFMKIGINFNASAESYQASFKTMLGVTENEAKEIYEKLRQFAVDTPYSMEGVTDSAVRLFNAGYDVEGTLEMLEVLGNIANGDSAKMERLVKAWTDTKGYGFLRAQERNQFVENGVMINQLLEDYYKSQGRTITADEITGMLTKKQVSDADVLNALLMAQEEGGNYYKAMENIMDTWGGQLEKTGDQLDQTAGAFTLPFFDELKGEVMPQLSALLVELETWSNENSDLLSSVASDLGSAATGALSSLLDLFTYLVERKDSLVPILEAVGTMFAVTYAANHPIVAAVGALLALASENPEAFDALATGLGNLAENGLGALTDALEGLLTWWGEHQTEFDAILIAVGALAFGMGNKALGATLIASGAAEMYSNFKKDFDAEYYGYREGNEEGSVGGVLAKIIDAFEGNGNLSIAGSVKDYRERLLGGEVDYEGQYREGTALMKYMIDQYNVALGAGNQEYAALMLSLYKELDPFVLEAYNAYRSGNGDEGRFGQPSIKLPEGTEGVGGSTGSSFMIAAFQQQLSAWKNEITAAAKEGVTEGVSGITITGHITTGDVKLNDGTIVGALTPYIDLKLGQAASQGEWG